MSLSKPKRHTETLENILPGFTSTPSLFGTSTEMMQPYVEITEQPTVRSKFRYRSEVHKGVPVIGASSANGRKTCTTITIHNHDGPVRLKAFCVMIKKPYSAHPYKLKGPNCFGGICIMMQDITQKSNVILVKDIAIQRQRAQKSAKDAVDMDAVRLKFQVDIQDENGSCWRPLKAVISDIIHQTKLVIKHAHPLSGTAAGGTTVTLLCEKLDKKDTVAEFYFEKNQKRWTAIATTVYKHQRCALVIVTPAFESTDIKEEVKVQIRLKRLIDNSRSDPIEFTYLPVDKGIRHTRQKELSTWLDSYYPTASAHEVSQWSFCQADSTMPGPFVENTLVAELPNDQPASINTVVYKESSAELKSPMPRELILNVSTLPCKKKPTIHRQRRIGHPTSTNMPTANTSMQLMTELPSTTAYVQPTTLSKRSVSTYMPTSSAYMQPLKPYNHAGSNKSYMTACNQSNIQNMTTNGQSVPTNISFTVDCMQHMTSCVCSVCTNMSITTPYLQSNLQSMDQNSQSTSTNITLTTANVPPNIQVMQYDHTVPPDVSHTTDYMQSNLQPISSNGYAACTSLPTTECDELHQTEQNGKFSPWESMANLLQPVQEKQQEMADETNTSTSLSTVPSSPSNRSFTELIDYIRGSDEASLNNIIEQ